MERGRAVDLAVFDLDGTLVDTAPDLVDTCNVVLAAHGVPPVTPETLRPHIGLGARAMIRASLADAGRTLSEPAIEAVFEDYLTHYATRLARHSRPFPEMLAALDTLAAADVTLAVCTNKREAMARALLEALGLAARFAVIAGPDTYGVMKPDPAHLWRTIAAAGGTPERTVFVGDSRVDYLTARAAGIPIVGVTYGYSEVPMAELGPDRLLGPGEDIGAAILSLLAAAAGG